MSQLQHFRRLALGLDPTAAIAELKRRPELWQITQLRQQYPGTAHADTDTIVLRGPTTAEDIFNNFECVDWPLFSELRSTTQLFKKAIGPLNWRDLGRVMIVRLHAGGEVIPHTDEGNYARYFARFHLVLESSPGCIFTAGGESVHMAPGEFWWFNHQVEHSVVNVGRDRTHIIVDLCAPGFTGALFTAAIDPTRDQAAIAARSNLASRGS